MDGTTGLGLFIQNRWQKQTHWLYAYHQRSSTVRQNILSLLGSKRRLRLNSNRDNRLRPIPNRDAIYSEVGSVGGRADWDRRA